MQSTRSQRACALLGSLFLAILIAGCQGTESSADEHIAKAKAFMAAGDLRPATIELANAIQSKDSAEARVLRARIALDLGDGVAAEKEIRRAIDLGAAGDELLPQLIESLVMQSKSDMALRESDALPDTLTPKAKAAVLGLRGQALILLQRFDLARAQLDAGLQTDASSPQVLVGLVAINGVQRRFDEAARWAAQGIERNPDSAALWSARGDVELRRNDPAAAEQSFSKAIALRKFPTLDRARRAFLYLRQNKVDAAKEDIKVLKAEGFAKHPLVNHIDGRLLFAAKRYSEAAVAFEQSHAEAPNFLPNRFYLAASYHLLGEQERALLHAKFIQGIAPHNRSANELLGGIQLSRGSLIEGRRLLEGVLKADPANAQVLRLLGGAALIEGDGPRGVEYFTKLAAASPSSEQAKRDLVTARLFAGMPVQGTEALMSEYDRSLLLALEALRDKKAQPALQMATKLAADHPDKVDPLQVKAAALMLSGQFKQAKAELDRAVKLAPGDLSVTKNLAKLELAGGNVDRAKTLVAPIASANPKDEDAALLLVSIERRLNNRQAATGVLERVVQANPDALIARGTLAAEHLSAGQFRKVLELTQGLTDDQFKRRPDLLELRGKALMMGGDAKAAVHSFEQWSKLDPGAAAAGFYLAEARAMSGDYAGAQASLDPALKRAPRHLPSRITEVKLLVYRQRIPEATKALARLRKDFGDQNEVRALEGWFALGTGRFADAESALTAAYAKKPDRDLAILLSKTKLAMGKSDDALAAARAWQKTRPDDLAISMFVAGTLLGLKRDEDARLEYAAIVQRNPDYVPALNNLAWLGRDKDPAQSIKHAEHAMLVAPRDPTVKDTLATLVGKRGDWARATDLLRAAVALAPNEPKYRLRLTQSLLAQQRDDDARAVVAELNKLAPGSEAAKQAQQMLAGASAPGR